MIEELTDPVTLPELERKLDIAEAVAPYKRALEQLLSAVYGYLVSLDDDDLALIALSKAYGAADAVLIAAEPKHYDPLTYFDQVAVLGYQRANDNA